MFSEKISSWLRIDSPEMDALGIEQTFDQIESLRPRLFDDYEPSEFERFEERLDRWLENLEEDDQQARLFSTLKHLFFVGRREFESLCRTAYHGPFARWIIDNYEIPLLARESIDLVRTAIQETWFCPITDSMRINAFLKLTNMEGKSHRPDWRSLRKFGDTDKIRAYVNANRIKNIVLLEDFVGSGTQIKKTVSFVAETFPEHPILVCPLICCPVGVQAGQELATRFANVTFHPVLSLHHSLFLSKAYSDGEPPEFGFSRQITEQVKDRFNDEGRQWPIGFNNTGAFVVLYSNCPNNTLGIFHSQSAKWNALFPRVRRA